MRYSRHICAAAVICVLAACSSLMTRFGFYEQITAEVRRGNYKKAVRNIEQAREKGRWGNKDRFLYFLDAGLAYHYADMYDTSNIKLHLAEQTSEELFTKSISRAAASLLLNDNVLAYAGEDYEVLYANLFKALNYLALDQFDEAFVEIRRADQRLDLLQQKYADVAEEWQEAALADTEQVAVEYVAEHVRFHNAAFARWLGMHMYATEGLYDDAELDYRRLHEAFSEQPFVYPFEEPTVPRLDRNEPTLSLVALVGTGPVKEALTLRLRTDKDLHLVQILVTDSEGHESAFDQLPIDVKSDFYFKFAIPRVAVGSTRVAQIRVYVNERPVGELRLLEDVGLVARETFKAKKSLIYLRTIARAIAKGIAAHKMKKKADTGGLKGWLKKAAIDAGADLTENADLRCAQLLPGQIWIGDFPAKSGEHDIRVEAADNSGTVLLEQTFEKVAVRPGRFKPLRLVLPF